MTDGDNAVAFASGEDEALFDAALNAPETGFADEPAAPAASEPQPEPASAPVVPAAAPAEPAPAPAPVEPAAAPEPRRVPLAELQRERERRQALERELEALRKPAEPAKPAPQVWDDPDGFVDHRVKETVNPVLSRVEQVTHTYSERDAVREHGRETVDAAVRSLEERCAAGDREAIGNLQGFMRSVDPYGEMVAWHKESTGRAVLGTDPDAYQAKLLDDPAFLARALAAAQAKAATNPVTSAAPSKPATPSLPSLNKSGQNAPAQSPDDALAALDDNGWYEIATRPRDAQGRFAAST